MGRHARGAARSRISTSTVLLGLLIVVVIAVGSWFGTRAQPTPIVTEQTTGSAVVVSSLACTEGAGGTLVDVLVTSGLPVRTSLDTCGHQEGELLAVSYTAGDPATPSPIGSKPVGLGVAALLGVCGVFAVWVDGRRQRRRAVSDVPAAHGAAEYEPMTEVFDVAVAPVPDNSVQLMHDEPVQPTGRHALPDPVQDSAPVVVRDDRRLSSVDLAFPFTSSLAASLHDELFTHRSVTT